MTAPLKNFINELKQIEHLCRQHRYRFGYFYKAMAGSDDEIIGFCKNILKSPMSGEAWESVQKLINDGRIDLTIEAIIYKNQQQLTNIFTTTEIQIATDRYTSGFTKGI